MVWGRDKQGPKVRPSPGEFSQSRRAFLSLWPFIKEKESPAGGFSTNCNTVLFPKCSGFSNSVCAKATSICWNFSRKFFSTGLSSFPLTEGVLQAICPCHGGNWSWDVSMTRLHRHHRQSRPGLGSDTTAPLLVKGRTLCLIPKPLYCFLTKGTH